MDSKVPSRVAGGAGAPLGQSRAARAPLGAGGLEVRGGGASPGGAKGVVPTSGGGGSGLFVRESGGRAFVCVFFGLDQRVALHGV